MQTGGALLLLLLLLKTIPLSSNTSAFLSSPRLASQAPCIPTQSKRESNKTATTPTKLTLKAHISDSNEGLLISALSTNPRAARLATPRHQTFPRRARGENRSCAQLTSVIRPFRYSGIRCGGRRCRGGNPSWRAWDAGARWNFLGKMRWRGLGGIVCP